MPKLASAVHALNAIRFASARHRVDYATSFRRFLHLYRNRRFSPYEIYFNDLLNPRISSEALECYISKEELIAFDRKHVLDSYLCVTSDKAVFYSLCLAAGIPVPKLLAVFDLPAGWTPHGRVLHSPADWCEFAQSLPLEFVVKPALGLLGKGFAAYRRVGDDFLDHEGHRQTAVEFYEALCHKSEQNLFATGYSHHSLKLLRKSHKVIIQERLHAHAAIAELTGSEALCTCRLLTHSEGSGSFQVLSTAFRVIGGNSIVDNFDRGTTGNLWCNLDAHTGRVVDAFARSDAGDRLERVARHPATGRDVVGFCIPRWAEVLALARHLANVFRPQSLIHWDIGIARDGPVAVEGNVGGQLLPTPLNRPVRALLA